VKRYAVTALAGLVGFLVAFAGIWAARYGYVWSTALGHTPEAEATKTAVQASAVFLGVVFYAGILGFPIAAGAAVWMGLGARDPTP
jgi:hypothetical protein